MKYLTIVGITIRQRLPDDAQHDWEWKSDPENDEECDQCGDEVGGGFLGHLSRTEPDGTDVPVPDLGPVCLPCAKQLVMRN